MNNEVHKNQADLETFFRGFFKENTKPLMLYNDVTYYF